ncbi:CPBP family intramembrane glutamic endopeptidase, BDIM_20840 family [Sphingomonas mucosissima]|uniref:CAAX amino terminal protease self-immunity n=1 Tax=Sphingomonas mucosissima TaxID=370959 RepID=A0A245ZQR3_9SPHN|nr:CPBP family intramembrane glutamic endopeptidase [Sphingomonas mucosissima]OWK32079.1 CAAX amino terminal protease self- immunity [Sphingomonas mucosissima]
MDAIISIASIIAMLCGVGAVISLLRPRSVDWRWLAIAAGLVLLNDLLLTNAYGLIRDVLPGRWNWQGKILALGATLAIAMTPAFGLRPAGITAPQAPGSLRAALPVALLYCSFFLAIAIAFPDEPPTRETIAFQLTMPGVEEELFYRGLLLLALDRAFTARKRLLEVQWGWGAIISCALFGLTHAFAYAEGSYSFDPIYMALTAVPSLIAIWLRLRTGSVLIPVLLHNFGNAIGLLV